MAAFAERGFYNTSIDSIAANVGVTRQGLFYHFPTKIDLLAGVLEQRDEDDAHRAQDLTEAGADLAGLLLNFIQRDQREPLNPQLLAVAAGESLRPDHQAYDFFRERIERIRSGLTALVAEEQARGRLTREVEAERLAVAILALMMGLNLQGLLEPQLDVTSALGGILDVLAVRPRAGRRSR
jgi:AcrR family transcriptional regulator